jgi:hypothetical protein
MPASGSSGVPASSASAGTQMDFGQTLAAAQAGGKTDAAAAASTGQSSGKASPGAAESLGNAGRSGNQPAMQRPVVSAVLLKGEPALAESADRITGLQTTSNTGTGVSRKAAESGGKDADSTKRNRSVGEEALTSVAVAGLVMPLLPEAVSVLPAGRPALVTKADVQGGNAAGETKLSSERSALSLDTRGVQTSAATQPTGTSNSYAASGAVEAGFGVESGQPGVVASAAQNAAFAVQATEGLPATNVGTGSALHVSGTSGEAAATAAATAAAASVSDGASPGISGFMGSATTSDFAVNAGGSHGQSSADKGSGKDLNADGAGTVSAVAGAAGTEANVGNSAQGLQVAGGMDATQKNAVESPAPAAAGPAAAGSAAAGSAATGVDEAAASTGINSSRVLQTMQGTEMRVGLHSDDFGSISIATSMSTGAIATQIALDHGGLGAALGHALSAHLPAMTEKLESALGMAARVEVRDTGSGAAAQGQQQGQQQAQQQGGTGSGTMPGGSPQGREEASSGRQSRGTEAVSASMAATVASGAGLPGASVRLSVQA